MSLDKIKVNLVSNTAYPIETLCVSWQQSRSHNPLLIAEYLHGLREVLKMTSDEGVMNFKFGELTHKYYGDILHTRDVAERAILHPDVSFIDGELAVLNQPISELVKLIIEADIPVSETVSFTFCIENYPVAWREQAVRTRQANYWLQTSRITDFSDIADAEKYFIPPAIMENEKWLESYKEFHELVQNFYKTWLDDGMKLEDARFILPSSKTERGNFTYNLRVLKTLFKKRSCFISQADMWSTILSGITAVLHDIDPLFAGLGAPPCIKKKCYTTCPFSLDMRKRMTGEDPLEPCPLYLKNEEGAAILYDEYDSDNRSHSNTIEAMNKRTPMYEGMWSGVPTELYNYEKTC